MSVTLITINVLGLFFGEGAALVWDGVLVTEGGDMGVAGAMAGVGATGVVSADTGKADKSFIP